MARIECYRVEEIEGFDRRRFVARFATHEEASKAASIISGTTGSRGSVCAKEVIELHESAEQWAADRRNKKEREK